MFLISNLFLSMIFRYSMQIFVGALLAFQIISHMPLINVNLPGSCFFTLSILTYVVSFDILPMDDFYGELDIFTETDPWSDRFMFLYYDSSDFI